MHARPHSVVLTALLIVVGLVACTPATTTPTPQPKPTPAAEVVLECAEGNIDAPSIHQDLRVTDTVGTVFARNPVTNVPFAADVGIPSPSSADWKFSKSPLLLAAGEGSVTISVPSDGEQYLLWVPAAVWVDDSSPNRLMPWVTHQVNATGCASTGVTFLGGVLVKDSTHCFALVIESTTGVRDEFEVRADGLPCW